MPHISKFQNQRRKKLTGCAPKTGPKHCRKQPNRPRPSTTDRQRHHGDGRNRRNGRSRRHYLQISRCTVCLTAATVRHPLTHDSIVQDIRNRSYDVVLRVIGDKYSEEKNKVNGEGEKWKDVMFRVPKNFKTKGKYCANLQKYPSNYELQFYPQTFVKLKTFPLVSGHVQNGPSSFENL